MSLFPKKGEYPFKMKHTSGDISIQNIACKQLC